MAPSLVGSDSFLGNERMRKSRNQTHVWVRTDMVEAILDNNGTLPRGWTPSRKRGRSSNTQTWGWARAYLVPQIVSATRTPEANTSSFGQVKLRRVNTSPITQQESSLSFNTLNSKGPEWSHCTPMTVTIHDDEFAPHHLQNVTVTLDPNHESAPLCMANSWWCETEKKPPDDLTSLTHLHEPEVVFCLKRRYEQDAIYTYTGKILLALNPFRECKKLYGDHVMKEYGKAATGERPPPHIYAVAQDAYDCMLRAMQVQNGSENQSVLVSGESGAGKTVTTKIIMQYLATLSRSHLIKTEKQTECGDFESQVLQSNPILESFGNARTLRNDNSSRFGKFIEIQFLSTGCLVSASIETYLLEKVRLITQAPGERNYNIFYELLSGAPQKDRRDLKIGNVTARDFRITASSGTFDRRDGVDDRETYRELLAALVTVGFTKKEQQGLFTVVCALLHASNLTFLSKSAESCELDCSNPSLRSTHTLLGVTPEKLQAALCFCAIEARGETLLKNMSRDQATKALDALIKATYGALFTDLVRRINSSITLRHDGGSSVDGDNRMASIGVLDIFGFESFDFNSFEQLCINYCNEALQQQFNIFVFKLEQQEYEREGIEWSFITFPDNQDVLDLIETKRTGILSILDEQCRLPTCTDMSFARATYEKCCEHPRFTASNNQKVSGAFSVHHYAGLVEYSTANFLEKNKDELPKETTELLMSSENPFLASLGILLRNQSMEKSQSPPGSVSSGATPARRLHRQSSSLMRESVGSQFASQLGQLRNRINQTTPHYVRCLKPNDDLFPDSFHPMVIADQLRCAGVLEVIRVSRVGFPQRYAHDAFLQRYHMLAFHELKPKSSFLRGKDLCEILVKRAMRLLWKMQNAGSLSQDSSPLSESACENVELGIQMGRSKVFLRRQAFDSLELLRGMRLKNAATQIQSIARMNAARLQVDIAFAAILILQKFARRMEATRFFNKLRRLKAATRMQCAWRGFVAERHFMAAILIAHWCQCHYRGSKAREICATLLLEHVVTIVQKHWRACIVVRRYRTILWVAVRVQTLHRQFKAREVLKQLQIEARDVNVLKAERDRFREEALQLRRELEAKKVKPQELVAQPNGHANKSVPAAYQRREFETPPWKENTTKYEKKIQSLAALSAQKDAELATLRDEIAFLRSPQGISSIHDHQRLSVVSSPARNENTPEKAVHTAEGEERVFGVDNPLFRSAVHEGDDTDVLSPARSRSTPERAVHTVRDGERSPTRTSRSLFSTKLSPSGSGQSRGGAGCHGLGLTLLDAVGLGDTGIMGVSPVSKHDRLDINGDSWFSVSSPPRSQNTQKAVHSTSNRVDDNEDRDGSADGQNLSFNIDALRFRKAVHEGDSETVENFLTESKLCDMLINDCDESGRSPLHVAVVESRWKVVGALLGKDAAANVQDFAGNTPLHLAQNASMMALLLKKGRANPNVPNMNGECALHLAVKKLDDVAVEVLLQHRADVNCADNTTWYTPIHLIAQADMDERAHLELLQDEFEGEKRKRVRIVNLLCGATDPFLFRCEPDLNYQDWEGNTPLHHVVMLTSEPAGEMLTIFLERGAKPHIVNNRGQTALHLLCHNDSLRKLEVFQDMLHDMLYHGADPNMTSLTGCTALHLSLYHRDVDSAIQLVNSGAELHLLWRKPKRWLSFWDDMGTSEVLALDMVDDEHTLHRILAAINRQQKWAPSRPWCMQCKSMLGSFSRALHCRHCGRLICGACAPRLLAPHFFPKSFEIYESSWVCVVCDRILVGRKEDSSSMTQPSTSFHDDDDDAISF